MSKDIHLSTWFFLLLCLNTYGQIEDYNYKREVQGVSDQWHKLILPNEIFGKVTQELSDIRIYGVTENNDTVEAPYILKQQKGDKSSKEIAFHTLNSTHNQNGYFFTFEVPTKESIDQINLDFVQQNYDWRLILEGSQNQEEWFLIRDNYRILSIRNKSVEFEFNKVMFPAAKFRYFRLRINSNEQPKLTTTTVTQHEVVEGNFRTYSIKNTKILEDKENNRTEIDLELKQAVPISTINIGIVDTFDYYRPITIKYLTDSFNTEQGWKYNYKTLATGTLNSIEENEFAVSSTTVKKLKISIHNGNNQPLKIDSLTVRGFVHELHARFTAPANYFLVYGNETADNVNYDIQQFVDKIPEDLTNLQLGEEEEILHKEINKGDPLFKDKKWLWIVMGVIILMLGWFSIDMIRKK